MFGLGAGEIFLIGVLALVFVGPKKLPQLARGLGRGIREFQKAKNDIIEEINSPSETKDLVNEKESLAEEVKSKIPNKIDNLNRNKRDKDGWDKNIDQKFTD
jgi:sec-independent protein translocase protein TatA